MSTRFLISLWVSEKAQYRELSFREGLFHALR